MNEDKARPLGDWLKQRREELEISLQQAEEDTRIRIHYLEALEAEEFASLPDPVVGRGFLRNYAVYLELDPQKATDLFSERVAPPEPESLAVDEPTPFTVDPFRPVPLHEMPGQRAGRVWLIALAVILVAALAVLAYWGYPRVAAWWTSRAPTAEPTPTREATAIILSTATQTPTTVATTAAPVTATTAPPTPTLELTLTPTFTPSPSPSPSPPIYTGIFLELVFTDTSWVQVTVDGVRQFQGELETETYRSWYGERRIELRVGNAGAVLVTVNGQFLGALGAPGEVLDRVFEIVDDQVTESTPTPVVTGTVTVEPTTPPPTTAPTAALSPTTAPTAAPPTSTITPTLTLTPTATITATTSP